MALARSSSHSLSQAFFSVLPELVQFAYWHLASFPAQKGESVFFVHEDRKKRVELSSEHSLTSIASGKLPYFPLVLSFDEVGREVPSL